VSPTECGTRVEDGGQRRAEGGSAVAIATGLASEFCLNVMTGPSTACGGTAEVGVLIVGVIRWSIILSCGMWDAINVGLLFFLVGSQNLWDP
jgi:hypothetical protein